LKPILSMISESNTMLMARAQAHAGELAHLRLAEVELLAPGAYGKRAQDEAERRRDQRGETHRESLLGLG
jgi:hypothetical protein